MNPETSKENNFFKEIIKFTVIALIIVIPIRAYIAQPFVVSGPSMDTTFANGQYLIVDELSYRLSSPSRGDVIIFKYPKDPSTYFIKRIIALPGETIRMENGKVFIENEANPTGFYLEEKYVTKEHQTSDTFTMQLGPTEYFVMGDNRPVSSDSRTWGPLESKYVIGRPFLRLLPFSKVSVFPGR